MATITSTATGNYGTGGTWVGGIVPVEGDAVVIAAAHTVTVDGTYIAGDDTITAFTVNGILKASRTVNSSLQIKGLILTAGTTTATIDYGRRSTTDPIPAGVTATLILNYSAAMVNYKYGLFVQDTSNFYACGATKTNNTTLVASISASATSATVTDATGWAIGDNVCFATSDGTYNHYEERVLTSVDTGTGVIGWTSGLTYAHAIACPVGNFTSNVVIKNYNTTNPGYIAFRHTGSASNNRREIDYVSFQYVGSNSVLSSSQVFVISVNTSPGTPFLTFSHNTFYNCGASGQMVLFMSQWNSSGFALDNLSFFAPNLTTAVSTYTASGTYVKITNTVYYYSAGTNHNSAFSQGGQGCFIEDNTFCSTGAVHVNNGNGDGLTVNRCKFHSVPSAFALVQVQAGSATFNNCSFASSDLWGTPVASYIFNASAAQANVFKGTSTDCNFGTPGTAFYLNIATANPVYIMYIANKNVDPSVQEIYTPQGTIVRDNTSKITGVTSLKMSPTSATNALTFVLYVPAPTGKKIGVSGYLWRDATNVSTVTLSGLGITPSVYTASGALSANEQFFVSGTQTTGTDGFLTLTLSTIGTSGNMWVDSVSAPQASAIDFGEFGYWVNALPAQVVTANTVTAGDVWGFLSANATVPGSMGKVVNLIKTLLFIK